LANIPRFERSSAANADSMLASIVIFRASVAEILRVGFKRDFADRADFNRRFHRHGPANAISGVNLKDSIRRSDSQEKGQESALMRYCALVKIHQSASLDMASSPMINIPINTPTISPTKNPIITFLS
jgi:hypothetical protein